MKRKNDHSHSVSESAFIHKSAKIGMNVHIEPNVVIEKNVGGGFKFLWPLTVLAG